MSQNTYMLVYTCTNTSEQVHASSGTLPIFDIEYEHPISVYDDISIMKLRYRSSDVVLRYGVRNLSSISKNSFRY